MKKKKQNNDVRDLTVTLIVAVIVLQSYGSSSLKATTFGDIMVAMLPVFALIALIFSGLLMLTKNSSSTTRAEGRQESLGYINLDFGQSIKHDLIMYITPVVMLIIPVLSNQPVNFTDFIQSLAAFSALAYLKILYWRKLF
jgi:hypothetical protein